MNYRSNPAILELANRLVTHNPGRHEKRLQACKPAAGEVRFLPFEDEQTEAASIVQEIAMRIESEGVASGDIAILFRTNEQPRLFEAELRRRRVRYILIGGQSFYDRREIRDMLAYLKVLARPDDEMSLLRIVNTPARGIGDATVEKLTTRAVRAGKSIWDVIPEAQAAGEIPARSARRSRGAAATFGPFRPRFSRTVRVAFRTCSTACSRRLTTGRKSNASTTNRSSSLPGWGRSISFGRRSRPMHSAPSPPRWPVSSTIAALLGRDEEHDTEETRSADAVKLMTLHSAKGLEFPRVYLVGLEEGLLPHRRSLEDEENSIAEERRLAYVGVTRAMTDLTISWAASRMKWGKRRPSIVSRFVQEMRQDGDDDGAEEAS